MIVFVIANRSYFVASSIRIVLYRLIKAMNYEIFLRRHLRDELLPFPRAGGRYSLRRTRRRLRLARSQRLAPKLLLLTHGHFDHVPDLAKIKSRFHCQVGCHPETRADDFRSRLFPQFWVRTGDRADLTRIFSSRRLRPAIFWGPNSRSLKCPAIVPAVSVSFPRSIGSWLVATFSLRAASAAGICPWATPTCFLKASRPSSSRSAIHVTVLPGHGPPTTIGQERRTNPFLA